MNTIREKDKKTDGLPRVGIDDGFVLWTVYHLFDALRQVSLFQQIRNISRLLWKKKYKHSHPDASKEDMDNAWKTNRPFTTKYLFSEIWVTAHLLLGVLCSLIMIYTPYLWLGYVILGYAMLRSFEIFVYHVNVLLFDPLKAGVENYKIKSATRMIILLFCNIAEYIIWFSVIYIVVLRLDNEDIMGKHVLTRSIMTLANISDPNEYINWKIAMVANIESVIGIFMNIVCLARFISILPSVHTIDKNSSTGAVFSCSSALQSWSGQEVDLLPQRMPLRRGMTSSMCCPRTNWLMP